MVSVLLQVNVGHPSEVDEIFDAISYSKGASVIRMLHNYIGDEVGCPARPNHDGFICILFILQVFSVSVSSQDFRKGMNAYLLKFQNKNASTGENLGMWVGG